MPTVPAVLSFLRAVVHLINLVDINTTYLPSIGPLCQLPSLSPLCHEPFLHLLYHVLSIGLLYHIPSPRPTFSLTFPSLSSSATYLTWPTLPHIVPRPSLLLTLSIPPPPPFSVRLLCPLHCSVLHICCVLCICCFLYVSCVQCCYWTSIQ